MSKVWLTSLLVMAALVVFSSFFWFQQVKYFRTRADVSQASFSIDNSYVFISPLRAQANGKERIRITVFVLNNQGVGVLGKKVDLTTDDRLIIESIQAVTDEYGKAVFDAMSTNQGEYYLEVKVEGSSLNQQAHLTYY